MGDNARSLFCRLSLSLLDQLLLLRLSFTHYIRIATTLIASLTFEGEFDKALLHFSNCLGFLAPLIVLPSIYTVLPITLQTKSAPYCVKC